MVENKGILVPQVRFKGGEGEWEQRKLGEVAEFNPRSTLPKVFEYVDLESVVGTTLVSHRTENKETAPSRAQRLAKDGDVFFQTVRPYQQNNYLFNLGLDNFVFSTGYAQLRPNIDSLFLLSLLQEKKFVAKVLDNCTGTSYPAINSTTLSEIEVCVATNTYEQASIGNFFRTLDTALTLHKRKLDGLKELKKGYLQQMFPQAGESVPRMRFAGYTDAWEQRKLFEVTEFYSGLTYSPDDVIESGGTLVLRSSNVRNGEVVNADNVYVKSDVVNCRNVEVGDVIVVVRNGSRSLIGKHAQIKTEMRNTVIGAFMAGLRSDQSEFVNTLLDTPQFDVEITKNLGATINQITTGAFKQMTFFMPSYTTEQTAIGNFFRTLDNQITTQAQKLEQLKKLKAAYLQKMFV